QMRRSILPLRQGILLNTFCGSDQPLLGSVRPLDEIQTSNEILSRRMRPPSWRRRAYFAFSTAQQGADANATPSSEIPCEELRTSFVLTGSTGSNPVFGTSNYAQCRRAPSLSDDFPALVQVVIISVQAFCH